jgi:transcriptional regulator with XRE-family HTH domain
MEQIQPLRRTAIAAELRGEAARQDISMQKLAEGSGINLATLRGRLKGKRPFTTDEIDRLTFFLSIPIVEFFERVEARR